ncbi:ATP-binding cassette domain-containing protein [Sphingobacterium sp. T2]|uniref:ATP-binding cassette domain-containing protein n=1 Tax=Sphingobacterium sp. T2 TaxID=1590596 RepID=UPI000B33A0B5|nr:ATP-binding cassette domain-containing protein [Sphingobacterium sp. T2]
MIEIRNIHKSFGDNAVLQGIDAVFEPGKVSLIIGGSGSGKSTLLKCMVGLHKPDEGQVVF